MELPVYLHGSDLLKSAPFFGWLVRVRYELLYEQMDGTSRSQWNKFTQHVAQNAVRGPQNSDRVASEAKWPGADLLYRLDQLLSGA